jgi:MFS family permease
MALAVRRSPHDRAVSANFHRPSLTIPTTGVSDFTRNELASRLLLREDGDRFTASPGVLSSFVVLQIVVYAGAQVPAGLLLDRYGSKALIVSGATVMAAGQLTLAFTESLPTAIAARAVVGLGDAVTFISVLRLVPHWFTPKQVPLVTQLTGICGQLARCSRRFRSWHCSRTKAGQRPTFRWSCSACCRSR